MDRYMICFSVEFKEIITYQKVSGEFTNDFKVLMNLEILSNVVISKVCFGLIFHLNHVLIPSDESSEFALRSYLYMLLHAVVGGPAAWWYGAAQGKVTLVHSILFYMLEILSMSPCTSPQRR